MSISQVILSSNVYSSNQTSSNRKVAEENRSRKVDGGGESDKSVKSLVPTEAINPDWQNCGPLNTGDLDRRYSTDPHWNNTVAWYHVWVQPMALYPDRYVLGTQGQISSQQSWVVNKKKDLDLGTKELHLQDSVNSIDQYYLPGDSEYSTLLQEMLDDVSNIASNNNSIAPYSYIAGPLPPNYTMNNVSEVSNFMQCVKNLMSGVEEINKETLKVFPNPVNSILNVQLPTIADQDIKVKIFNVVGQEVKELTIPKGEKAVEWDVKNDNISSGVYIYQIKVGSEVVNGKIQVLN